ncbi:MAG: sel1 repeat family protein [Deltaproteobacteria bacterium]|nr:sel1 repeat family protein [Deltaproteobacteria bacterium]
MYILKDLAERFYSPAFRSLGLLYLHGEFFQADPQEALEWFKKGIDSGSVECLFELAQMYDQGLGVEVDQDLADEYYQKSAESGDFRGQHFVAQRLVVGQPIKDDARALSWFLKAAESGFSPSQFAVGVFFELGLGTEKDIMEAARWYEKLAQNGVVEAQIRLSLLCLLNPEVPDRQAKAVKWAAVAANSGSSEGQNLLGKIYALGLGVPPDLQKALELFTLAADQGQGLAMLNLIYIFRNGFAGILPDRDLVVKWVMKGLEMGYSPAKYVLGLMYREGTVLEKNVEQADNLLAELGDDEVMEIERLLSYIKMEFISHSPAVGPTYTV